LSSLDLALKIIIAVAILLLLYRLIYRRRVTAELKSPSHALLTDGETLLTHRDPRNQFCEVDGIKIRYIQSESGLIPKPDLVLIHGIGSSIYSWRTVFEELAKKYRVTAIDLPGYGLSDKRPDKDYGLDKQTERVFQLLDKLHIKKFYLAGHSMGGGISAWMSKTRPERVMKLALLAPAVSHRIAWLNPDYWWWGVHALKRFVVTPKLVKRLYLRATIYNVPTNLDEVVHNIYEPFHRSPDTVVTFVKHLYLLRDKRLSQIHDLSTPAILLYGDHDLVIDEKHFRDFLKHNPRIKFIRISRSGHQIMEEKPAEVVEIFTNFFD
jgi:pimeloyl-ACP methyl ester carboxylesterase